MNTSNVKKYAPKARKAFIDAMSKQAAKYGITDNEIVSAKRKGDVVLIGGKPFPTSIIKPRDAFVAMVKQLGFEQAIDKVAYSWFNRLCALRYMELHDYLEHGRRVLSHPEHPTGFQLLDDCLDVDLPDLDKALVRELKLDGTKDEELYRELLLAQCRALHNAMPFLFELVDDATELLLPENLTKTNSLIHDLITDIPEADWQSIEIVGWIYQFYISEKKDEVIGKVVKSEDIPAATQLFTPNWIVKYMVQNSLGAQWLATYPDSPLKEQLEFYIEPAEQSDEVNDQLNAITPERLNPEELTFIDPASGSGHILVEAYDLFKAIYLERAYQQRYIPQLILEKNLFGLDIDERAAQLTGFAIMMKGRADDRRLFERKVKLNVISLVDSTGFDTDELTKGVELDDYGLEITDIAELKRMFQHATTFGSLIQVPNEFVVKLPLIKTLSEVHSQDMFVSDARKHLGSLVLQAELLGGHYDAVIANPPYMGGGGMNALLRQFTKDYFIDSKSDLFACFIERGCDFAKNSGHSGMVTMQSWMFLSSFEKLRKKLLQTKTLVTMAHLGARAFASISGEVVQTTASVMKNSSIRGYKPVFFRLLEGSEDAKREALSNGEGRFDDITQLTFETIPGNPLAYWAGPRTFDCFSNQFTFSDVLKSEGAVKTGNNDRYIRNIWEVRASDVGSEGPWRKHPKGGGYRKWYGNLDSVVEWRSSSRQHYRSDHIARIPDEEVWDKEGITWSAVSSSRLSFRYEAPGEIANNAALFVYAKNAVELSSRFACLNAVTTTHFLAFISPTLNYLVGDVLAVPALRCAQIGHESAELLRAIAKRDWDAFEGSCDFKLLHILSAPSGLTHSLESSYVTWITENRETIAEMKRLEEENNRLFIDAYNLADELSPEVPIEQITLIVNPAYRYAHKLKEADQWVRFREDSMEEVVSYAIGCMMGRYSLDQPSLVYAHSGNQGFDPSNYSRFPADEDGIMPLTLKEWYDDDVANRLVEFIAQAWDDTHLEANLRFLADNLTPKKGEGTRDTLRRYLCDRFFKDHLQAYKRRPIYWLFSSGKLKTFQCLVYLHRYNEGTLARMRTEYVIPLTARMAAYVQKLENDKEVSGSAAEVKRFEKEITLLHKQQAELSEFDERLRHYADQRISLDLDDGVKVNYGKFGDLLAEVKAVTGKAPSKDV